MKTVGKDSRKMSMGELTCRQQGAIVASEVLTP